MYVTHEDGMCDVNPLEMYDEEYADRETLHEMLHEMMDDDDDCDCEECMMSDSYGDSMPDLEGTDESENDIPAVPGAFGPGKQPRRLRSGRTSNLINRLILKRFSVLPPLPYGRR